MPRKKKTETVENALTVAAQLPGQATEDAALVSQVVVEVNTAYETGGLQTMRQIGKIVLERMFGGDVGRFHEAEKSHVSFRALAKHPDLHVSASNLWYSIAIEDNFRLLGDAAQQLGASQHRRLVHVADEAARVELAHRTIDEGLTIERLEAEIIAARKPALGEAKRGRPALPTTVKQFGLFKRTVADLGNVVATDLQGLDAPKATAMLEEARALQTTLAVWLGQLQAELEKRVEAES